MNKKLSNKYILMLSVMLLPLTLAPIAVAQTKSLDSIVAVVDENVIMRSELDQAIVGVSERIRLSGGQMPAKDLLEKQVLENLITSKLQTQRAMQTGIRVSDTEIDNSLSRVAQQNSASIDQLRSAIEQDGFDFAEFRQTIREDIMQQKLRQRIANSMVTISESEIDLLLESQNLDGGEFLLSHILISIPEGATPAQLAEGSDKVNDVYRRLQDGMDFKSAAISYSESPEAIEGGELGWRDLNSIPRYFAESISPLAIGQTTEPMRSPAGFHIFRVDDRRERGKVIVREYHARHIMLRISELLSARQAMDKIMDIKRQLDDGADFAEMARHESDDSSTANLGGDLGWFEPNMYGERMRSTLEGLKVNQISEPFQTEVGWHIAQFLGEREEDRTTESIRNNARNQIMQRKSELEVNKFIRQMRDEAYVEIRLDGQS